MVVTRTRPQDGTQGDMNSDDQISDEELTLGSHDLKDALKTHVGGTNQMEDEELTANRASQAAVNMCKTVWLVTEDEHPKSETFGKNTERKLGKDQFS